MRVLPLYAPLSSSSCLASSRQLLEFELVGEAAAASWVRQLSFWSIDGQRDRRREAADGEGDDGGRDDVQVQAAGVGGGGAARPPGLPGPGVGGGQAPRDARAAARRRRAAQARQALLPRQAPPPRPRAAADVVGRACPCRRRRGEVGEHDAVAAVGVGRGGVAGVVGGGRRGRRGAAADAAAQGGGGAACEGEPRRRRGRREDHAALRRQGPQLRAGHPRPPPPAAAAAAAAGGARLVGQEEGRRQEAGKEQHITYSLCFLTLCSVSSASNSNHKNGRNFQKSSTMPCFILSETSSKCMSSAAKEQLKNQNFRSEVEVIEVFISRLTTEHFQLEIFKPDYTNF